MGFMDKPIEILPNKFSAFKFKKKYKFVLKDFMNPEEYKDVVRKNKQGVSEPHIYYIYKISPLETYEDAGLFEGSLRKQFFSETTFRYAIGEYCGKNPSLHNFLETHPNDKLDFEMIIERKDVRRMIIHQINIMNKGGESNDK